MTVNLIIAVPLAIASTRLLRNDRPANRTRIDLPGAVAAFGALVALVFGLSNAETSSWRDPVTVATLAASVALLAAFVAIERHVSAPLLPLGILRSRARAGAYACIAILSAGALSLYLFLSFYLQQNLGFAPILTGIGFLPMTVSVIATTTTVQTRLMPRIGPKPVMVTGLALGTVGMIVFSRLSPHGSYPSMVLPALVVTGVGFGCVFAASMSTGTLGVAPAKAGVAAAMVNTSQQIGGSVGTALLSTIFASAVSGYLASHSGTDHVTTLVALAAHVHGYRVGFAWAAGMFGVGLIIALLLLPRTGPDPDTSTPGPSADARPALEH
jgi:hypothetical protein